MLLGEGRERKGVPRYYLARDFSECRSRSVRVNFRSERHQHDRDIPAALHDVGDDRLEPLIGRNGIAGNRNVTDRCPTGKEYGSRRHPCRRGRLKSLLGKVTRTARDEQPPVSSQISRSQPWKPGPWIGEVVGITCIRSSPSNDGSDCSEADPHPARWNIEECRETLSTTIITRLPYLPLFYHLLLLLGYLRQQLRSRLVVGILRHQLAAHRQIEDEASQARDRVGRVGDAVKVSVQAIRDHLVNASVKIAFNRSRTFAASASAAVNSASSVSGSPCSSSRVFGFLKSRL